MPKPKLTFFCELDADALTELFADGSVIEDLQALDARISLGILDLSDARAAVVKQLNEAGVPVTAWQLLPKAAGYWYNVYNAAAAAAQYTAFKDWTAGHGLQWAGIGIDIEPDIRDMEDMVAGRWSEVLPGRLARLFNDAPLRRAQMEYEALITRMHEDGFTVERYSLPTAVDEARAGSTLIQRLMGVVEPAVDRVVPMLYSSFAGEIGPATLWSYAQDVDAVAVGSTGGGVEILDHVPGDRNVLTWDPFIRDVLLASRWVGHVYVFSLEGCVEQGILALLKTFDWDHPPLVVPPQHIDRVALFRDILHAVLWLSVRPFWVAFGVISVLWVLRGKRR